MTDKQVAFWLIVMMVIEVFAVGIAFFYVFPQDSDHLHTLQKIGFTLLVFGLVVQIVRSIHYLENGFYPVDKYFPMWITKDLGGSILIYYYAFINKKQTNS